MSSPAVKCFDTVVYRLIKYEFIFHSIMLSLIQNVELLYKHSSDLSSVECFWRL